MRVVITIITLRSCSVLSLIISCKFLGSRPGGLGRRQRNANEVRGVDRLMDVDIYGHMDMSIWTYSKFLQVMVEFRPYV